MFVRDFTDTNPYVPPQLLRTTESLQEPDMWHDQEALDTSTRPEEERATTPSDSALSPPSPRLRQLPDPDDEPLSLESPYIRDDMDLDDDIPVWDPEDDDGAPSTRQVARRSDSDVTNAYQEHLKGFLRKHSSEQMEQTPKSTPAATPELDSGPVRVETKTQMAEKHPERWTEKKHAEIIRAGHRPLHPDVRGRRAWKNDQAVGLEPPEAQKAEGSDKKLLEALFMSVERPLQ
ncbi:hypothetical protein E8E11_011670 [Didymella keratinophila]|nr:hypothetical protein E8E11_011670 [Didymella keratinophila]